ncbi:MAG: hypothetical protein FWE49_01485 [Synergistaceae bacterium]|nr:hypothetical protein [Synergistaceae bacterium]
MRPKLLLFISVVFISFALNMAAVVMSAGNDADQGDKSTSASLNDIGKEEMAKQILFEIRNVDDPAAKAMLYRKLAEECSSTEFAQEALWKLSQLHLDGFDEPNVNEAIGCLERFIKIYPDSEWRSHVEFSLLGLYENEKLWAKTAGLSEKLIAENPNMPNRLKEELLRRYKAAKKLL